MKDSKKKTILKFIFLNLIIPLILFLFVILFEKTNISLYFSKPVSYKSDYSGKIFLIVMPIYEIILLIIQAKANKNKNNKVKSFFKQFFIGAVVYSLFFAIYLPSGFFYNYYAYTFKSPDNKTTYIFESESRIENSSFTLKKGSYISSKKLDYISIVKFPCASIEVSWIDNQTFNLKFIPPSWESQKDKTAEYYTFKSLEKLEPIEYSDYVSKQYIKTEELIIK